MNELQKKEFELLREFIRVCDTLGLTYYLVCGTCLGAVKYKGFIPWDDDLDAALPRKDYRIFLDKAQGLLGNGVFLQTFETDENFPNFFAKLRDSRTTFIEKSVRHIDMNHGIYIDVFPLDGYPDDPGKQQEIERFKQTYGREMSSVFDTGSANFKVKALAAAKKILRVRTDARALVRQADKLFSSYPTEDSELWCNHGNWQGVREYAPRGQYGSGTEAEFEGIKVRIPEKYDEYLTQKYGDWRADLPEEERKGHHCCEICDTERPYTDYVERLPGGGIEISADAYKERKK